MPRYDFKFWQELAWSVGISFAIFILTAFLGSEDTTDWTVWAKTVALGGARSAAGIIIAAFSKPSAITAATLTALSAVLLLAIL